MISLQSGSSGNCIYVESGRTSLLFDAGISGRQVQLRLAACGRDVRGVDAVIISHDHADHARCLGIYQRKFRLPVYVTPGTLAAARACMPLGELGDVRTFRAGGAIRLDGLRIETIPTPHDAADGVAFVVDDGRARLGILTDLGHAFAGLADVVGSLDAVLLESNYDPDMLEWGPYPPAVKRRIRGPGGHLSNVEAAELLAAAAGRKLRWACLGHLSEHNNHPAVALDTWRAALGSRVPLYVAAHRRRGEVLEI
ncbi:MAG: MBL fold metallo-hydrolase [Planctomycetes bacterium]|nr:MBL fold metallo-hydrolase [Planctomycetota bacterium]